MQGMAGITDIWHVLKLRHNVAVASHSSGGVHMWRLVVIASLLFAAAGRLAAQFPTDVAVGSRVRVVVADSVRQQWAPSSQWLRGDVAALSRDTLYLRLPNTEAPVPIRQGVIRRLDRSLGVPGRLESAMRGAIGLAFWGAISLGVVRATDDGGSVNTNRFWEKVGEGAAYGAGIGFVLGTIFPTERWRRIRLR
jgi:hypothetical protein